MLPARLSALDALAHNLWWSWDTEATALWASVDPWRWKLNRHNPVALIREVEPERWVELADDEGFLRRVDAVHQRFREYLSGPGWCRTAAPDVHAAGIAYFSMEFGLHESLRIYSGGLGVLAGDHLRSASDLGVPIVGIGLLYREGYFRQVLDDGVQLAAYPQADFDRLPTRFVRHDDGSPLQVEVPMGPGVVQARIHRVDVGRVRLYLLDVDHEGNPDHLRALTSRLYGGDARTRIQQEVLLGIGGVRALRALGERVGVYHLNEGHCAFAVLELMREANAQGSTWDEALVRTRRSCVFTTHTPVPAGHDRFGWNDVDDVLGNWRSHLGLPPGSFMDLGRVSPGDWHEALCMTVLALRGASRSNGVSKLHGAVSRSMWQGIWPHTPVDDVPIGHVTNGVHPIFWAAPATRELFDAHLPGWREAAWDPSVWSRIGEVPDEALWTWRERLRRRLFAEVERRTGLQLDPAALTIGFARRFAPYKRGDLLFRDPERLLRLLEGGPVQVLFAGKAHPRDATGRGIVASVLRWAADRRFRGRIVFLEDYDIDLGALLTSGVDVWLNNPRRPQEASGTSGQKVVLNGGLNLSVLDGWWPEGFDGTNGWAIGDETSWDDLAAQDEHDAASLYRVLEDEVLPLWRRRGDDDVPRGWLERVRRSVVTCGPVFNSHRMVRDYVEREYTPVVRAAST